MKVRYSPRALQDLGDILGYLDERSPQAAESVRNAISKSIDVLADFPFLAPATELPNVREMTIHRYPYNAYYTVEAGEVWIIHIRDSRRRSWIDETPE